MGFQITTGAWFYIIVMIIVVYIGISIVTGLNPLNVFQKIGHVFEPGKLYITNDNPEQGGLEKFTKIDCTPNAPVVILDGLKFYYKGEPGSQSSKLHFAIILDYKGPPGGQSKLIVGRHDGGEVIECSVKDDAFDCPQNLKMRFELQGIGDLQPKEVFHFTTWLETSKLRDDARSMNFLKELLEKYSEFYLSSFDVALDKASACGRTNCESQMTEGECIAANCYWGPWYFPWGKSCKYCQTLPDCDKYDKDQCTQCAQPRSMSCKPTLLGCEA